MTFSKPITIEIQAPCDEVFPWLVQPERVKQWLPAITSWAFTPSYTDVPVQGTAFTIQSMIGTMTSTLRGEILGIEAPHLLVAHGSNEFFSGKLHIRLQSLAMNRCQLKIDIIEEKVGLVVQLFKNQMDQSIQIALQKLKYFVEEGEEV